MAGTTSLKLATSAVTVQRPEVTNRNFTAPVATFGAPRNPQEFLLHPNCTQIFPHIDQFNGLIGVVSEGKKSATPLVRRAYFTGMTTPITTPVMARSAKASPVCFL